MKVKYLLINAVTEVKYLERWCILNVIAVNIPCESAQVFSSR